FAERGYPAVAFDYFGRSAGVAKRDDEFPYMDHVAQTTPECIRPAVAATAAHLRSADGGGCSALVTVGFCFGGHHSWLAAARGPDLAGPGRVFRRAGARARARRARAH